jgi:hypothetical protein
MQESWWRKYTQLDVSNVLHCKEIYMLLNNLFFVNIGLHKFPINVGAGMKTIEKITNLC